MQSLPDAILLKICWYNREDTQSVCSFGATNRHFNGLIQNDFCKDLIKHHMDGLQKIFWETAKNGDVNRFRLLMHGVMLCEINTTTEEWRCLIGDCLVIAASHFQYPLVQYMLQHCNADVHYANNRPLYWAITYNANNERELNLRRSRTVEILLDAGATISTRAGSVGVIWGELRGLIEKRIYWRLKHQMIGGEIPQIPL